MWALPATRSSSSTTFESTNLKSVAISGGLGGWKRTKTLTRASRCCRWRRTSKANCFVSWGEGYAPQAAKMVNALTEAGKPFDVLPPLLGQRHALTGVYETRVREARRQYFQEHLKPEGLYPSPCVSENAEEPKLPPSTHAGDGSARLPQLRRRPFLAAVGVAEGLAARAPNEGARE